MMLIVELVAAWCVLSVAVGVPLGRRIRRADEAEFPWRREDPWWVGQRPAGAPTPARPDVPALV